jgi:hypothetical protein
MGRDRLRDPGQLRLVAADCAAGRDEAALQRIAQIQARLTRSAR